MRGGGQSQPCPRWTGLPLPLTLALPLPHPSRVPRGLPAPHPLSSFYPHPQARDSSLHRALGDGAGPEGQEPPGAEVLFREICEWGSARPRPLPQRLPSPILSPPALLPSPTALRWASSVEGLLGSSGVSVRVLLVPGLSQGLDRGVRIGAPHPGLPASACGGAHGASGLSKWPARSWAMRGTGDSPLGAALDTQSTGSVRLACWEGAH